MLRYMHRIQRHVLWVVLVGAVALAMTGFGMGSMNRRANAHIEAAVVNGVAITAEEVAREVFATKARYRQIFGDKADELMKQLGLNLESQATDDLIDKTLIEQQVDALGLVVPKNEVVSTIRTQLASAGFNVERFRSYLRQMGMTEEDFQVELGKDIKRGYFAALLNHAGHVSKREALERKAQKSASFDLEGVEFKPAIFMKGVAEPTAEAVEKYFTEHETEFQVPAQVAFEAAAISPDLVLNEVLVDDPDIERYYTEHQGEFQEAAKGRYETFSLAIPKDADPATISSLQEKATKTLKAITDSPVKEASILKDAGFSKPEKHELSAKDASAQGRAALAFAKVGFVETPTVEEGKISLVAVRNFTPSVLKPLDTVRSDIESKLRRREAPAYAATKANELFVQWKAKGGSLKDFLAASSIKVVPIAVSLVAVDGSVSAKVPASVVKFVGSRAFSDTSILVEDGAVSYLVAVTDKKESTLQSLSSVGSGIKSKLKDIAAMQLLRTAADSVQAELKKNPTADLNKLVASYGLTVEKATYSSTSKKADSGILKNPMVTEFVKSAKRDLTVGSQPILAEGIAYVVRVNKVNKKPVADLKPEDAAEEIATASGDSTRVLLDAFIASQKAHANIELKTK
jgi:hypothetical protein